MLQDIMETRGNRISEPGYRPDYPRRQYHGALILRLGRLLQANQANPGPNQATKEQYKYAPDKHILLYNLAFLSDKIEDTKATEHYLQAFLRTKSKQNAVLQQPDDDEEEPAPYIDYYKSATNKLESIRKEKFLKGEK